uniref:Uncharacterized protein n=1 Tax=Arundo donax TaxID=35708 RepID=A0A0A8ZRG0_ARUDO
MAATSRTAAKGSSPA